MAFFFFSDNLKPIFRHFKTAVKQKHGRDGAVRKDKVSKKNWIVNLGCPVDPDIL